MSRRALFTITGLVVLFVGLMLLMAYAFDGRLAGAAPPSASSILGFAASVGTALLSYAHAREANRSAQKTERTLNGDLERRIQHALNMPVDLPEQVTEDAHKGLPDARSEQPGPAAAD